MPIPGSREQGNISTAGAESLYPSLCTFYKPNYTQDSTGQQIRSYVVVDADHTGVACRKSPLIIIRPQNQESVDNVTFHSTHVHAQLNFIRHFSDLDQEWRVVVDGVSFEILAVEEDGSKLTSRLQLGQILPFNV